MKTKNFITAFMLVGLVWFGSGCNQSPKIAQIAYDRAVKADDDVTTALFVKAWGTNRIAGAEANAKELEKARVELLRAQLKGDLTPEKSEKIIDDLGARIANNEPKVTKGFAWLAFLLQQHERAQSLMGHVDFYLQSQHSIGEQLSDQVGGGWADTKESLGDWNPILGDLTDAATNIVNRFKGGKPDPQVLNPAN